MFYLVYFTATGKADSYGSVLADPMPAEFTVRPMSDDETSGVLEGRLMWDADSLTFVQNPNWTPPEADADLPNP
jgi:hypothetical protein